jgi:excisionase family DNA binding protein
MNDLNKKKDVPEKLAYSIKEACNATSLSRTTIYTHIKSQRLRAVRINGRTVIPAEALHKLVHGEG